MGSRLVKREAWDPSAGPPAKHNRRRSSIWATGCSGGSSPRSCLHVSLHFTSLRILLLGSRHVRAERSKRSSCCSACLWKRLKGIRKLSGNNITTVPFSCQWAVGCSRCVALQHISRDFYFENHACMIVNQYCTFTVPFSFFIPQRPPTGPWRKHPGLINLLVHTHS